MKAKKILCSLLSVAMIGSVGTLGVSAADYTEYISMASGWTRWRVGSDLECQYWTGCSAETSLSVTYTQGQSSTAYVYLKGQGQSTGNRQQSSTYNNGWIKTGRCYATGKYAEYTYHSYDRAGDTGSYKFVNT